LLTYFLNDFEMVPVAPIITGITFVSTLHMRCISIVRSLYFRIFSVSFLITFLSPKLLLLLLLFSVVTFPKSFSLNTLICSIFIKTSYGGASLYVLNKKTHWKTRTLMEGSTYWGAYQNRSEGPKLWPWWHVLILSLRKPCCNKWFQWTHHAKHTITKHT
jgi:hypothetical protein